MSENGLYHNLKAWSLDILESGHYLNLRSQKDSIAVKRCAIFSDRFKRPIQVEQPDIRDIILNTDIWRIEEPYRQQVFQAIEDYLFNNVVVSHADEWQRWLKLARLAQRIIPISRTKVAEKIWQAYTERKLNTLSQEDRSYLFDNYWRVFSVYLKKRDIKNHPEIFPLLLELKIKQQSLSENDFQAWIKSTYKNVLEERLTHRKDNLALTELVTFSFNHLPPFPIHQSHIRDVVFTIDSWNMPQEYLAYLFECVEAYLFNEIATSTTTEWFGWFKHSRLQNRLIQVQTRKTSKALEAMRKKFGLDFLPKPEYDFWLDCYTKPFASTLSKIETQDWNLVIDRLIRVGPIGNIEAIPVFLLSTYKTILQDRFVLHPNCESLKHLVDFSLNHYPPFPIQDQKVRDALLLTPFWEMEEPYREDLLTIFEDFLIKNIEIARVDEWHIWLKALRLSEKKLNVTRGNVALALRDAHITEKFNDLPSDDYQFLLEQYLRVYGNILTVANPESQNLLLPVLLQFGSVVQMLNPNEQTERVLSYWANNLHLRPRALTEMKNNEAFNAPIFGIGSPNGISITIFYDTERDYPTRICSAGISGDAILNEQVFTGLFAHALNCDIEETFLSVNGAFLTLGSGDETATVEDLRAVLDWRGEAEPLGDIPTLGLDDQKSLEILVNGLLGQSEEVAGLVNITRWSDLQDSQNLRATLEKIMTVTDSQPVIISSQDTHFETGSIIQVIPLLYRNVNGEVVPIEIEVPDYLLGPNNIYHLLRILRMQYMDNLIQTAKARELESRRHYDEQSKLIDWWKNLSEVQKQEMCEAHPYVDIWRGVDFEQGITITYDKPVQEERRVYEENTRPSLRDDAKIYADKFESLHERLVELNRDGGKADLLTFKLLVDALIRQAPLKFPNDTLETEYKNWVQLHFAAVWAAIEYWGRNQGLEPEHLTADNILFNAKRNRDEKKIVIQPWVMVDLQDFNIVIDREKGLMTVCSANKIPTLNRLLLPNKNIGINNLEDLHQKFLMWSTDLHNSQGHFDEILALYTPNLKKAIRYYKAKDLLLIEDEPQKADPILKEFCDQNFIPAYFWYGVNAQCRDEKLRSLGKYGVYLSVFYAVDFVKYLLNQDKIPKQLAPFITSEREMVFGSSFSTMQLPRLLLVAFLDNKPLAKEKQRTQDKLFQELLSYSAVSKNLQAICAINSLEDVITFLLSTPNLEAELNQQFSVNTTEELHGRLLSIPEAQERVSIIEDFLNRNFSGLFDLSKYSNLEHQWLLAFLKVTRDDLRTADGWVKTLQLDPLLKEYMSRILNEPAKFILEQELNNPVARTKVDAFISCNSPETALKFLLSVPVIKEQIDQVNFHFSPRKLFQEFFDSKVEQTTRSFLRKLISLDKEFGQTLADIQPHFFLLLDSETEIEEAFKTFPEIHNFISDKENLALDLTDEEKRLLNLKSLLSSVEFFNLAEDMKRIAKTLLFRLEDGQNVHGTVKEIIQQTQELTVKEPSPSASARIERLPYLAPQ